MKELIEEGHIYIAALYLVKKETKKEYAWNDVQRDQANERMGGVLLFNVTKVLEMNARAIVKVMDPNERYTPWLWCVRK
jgi:DNA gyrase subunit B